MNRQEPKNRSLSVAVALVSALLIAMPIQAATVNGGVLTINLNRDALIAGTDLDNFPDTPTESFPICCRPSIYVEEFWDASHARDTFDQLRENNTPDLYDLVSDEISALGLQFGVNGAAILPNVTGRKLKATTFNFDPDNLFGTASGHIGLNGVIRFRVDVAPPQNRIILGDLTLNYDPDMANATPGRSGWVLTNHIVFDAGAFELFDVTTSLIGNNLTISGNLGFGDGFDHLGATAARLADTRIG